MLSLLRRWGAEVLPSNSRARRRQASSPPQGPPASRPVGGLRTFRECFGTGIKILGSLHPQSEQPPATSASFFVSEGEGMRGRKVQARTPSSKCQGRAVAFSRSAVREACRLRRFAWGRPGAKGRVSEQVRHTTFVTVPPRYGSAVVKPARYSSTPCDLSTSVRSSPCVRSRSRIAAVRTRLQGHKVFRAGRIRPSRPLAQSVSG